MGEKSKCIELKAVFSEIYFLLVVLSKIHLLAYKHIFRIVGNFNSQRYEKYDTIL